MNSKLHTSDRGVKDSTLQAHSQNSDANLRRLIPQVPSLQLLPESAGTPANFPEDLTLIKAHGLLFAQIGTSKNNSTPERQIKNTLTAGLVEIEKVLPPSGMLSVFGLMWAGNPGRGGYRARALFKDGSIQSVTLMKGEKIVEELKLNSEGKLKPSSITNLEELLRRIPRYSQCIDEQSKTRLLNPEEIRVTVGSSTFLIPNRTRVREERLISDLVKNETIEIESILPPSGCLRWLGLVWQGRAERGGQKIRAIFSNGQLSDAIVEGEDGARISITRSLPNTKTKVKTLTEELALADSLRPLGSNESVTLVAPRQAILTRNGLRYFYNGERRLPERVTSALQHGLLQIETIVPPGNIISILGFSWQTRGHAGETVKIEFVDGKVEHVQMSSGPGGAVQLAKNGKRLRSIFAGDFESFVKRGRILEEIKEPLFFQGSKLLEKDGRFFILHSRVNQYEETQFSKSLRSSTYSIHGRLGRRGALHVFGKCILHAGNARQGLDATVSFHNHAKTGIQLFRNGKEVETFVMKNGSLVRKFLDRDERAHRLKQKAAVIRPAKERKNRSRSLAAIPRGQVQRYPSLEIEVTADYHRKSKDSDPKVYGLTKGRVYQRLIMLMQLASGRAVIPEVLVRKPSLMFCDLYCPGDRSVLEIKFGAAIQNIRESAAKIAAHLDLSTEKRRFDRAAIIHLVNDFTLNSTRPLAFSKVNAEALTKLGFAPLAGIADSLESISGICESKAGLERLEQLLNYILASRLGISQEDQGIQHLTSQNFLKAAGPLTKHELDLLVRVTRGEAVPGRSLPFEYYCFNLKTDRFEGRELHLPLESIRTVNLTLKRSGAAKAIWHMRRALHSRDDKAILSAVDHFNRLLEKIPDQELRSPVHLAIMISLLKNASLFLLDWKETSTRVRKDAPLEYYQNELTAFDELFKRLTAGLAGGKDELSRFVDNIGSATIRLQNCLKTVKE